MTKSKTPAKAPSRIMPATGGSSIRDKVTGEMRPNNPPDTEPAAEPAQEGK